MTAVEATLAFKGTKYVETSFDLALFRTVEYDGTNAGDVMTWVSGNSINNGLPYIRNDSGTLKVQIRASAVDSGLSWGGYGDPVEIEVPANSKLLFQGNYFMGLLNQSLETDFYAV